MRCGGWSDLPDMLRDYDGEHPRQTLNSFLVWGVRFRVSGPDSKATVWQGKGKKDIDSVPRGRRSRPITADSEKEEETKHANSAPTLRPSDLRRGVTYYSPLEGYRPPQGRFEERGDVV